MKLRHIATAAIVVACLVSGCASVNKADRNASTQAKTFSPITDKAVVYIYRDEILGSAIKLHVSVDGIVVGDTGPKSFLQLALPPGPHTITSRGEKIASLSLDTQAGQTYYVWQEVKMGMWSANSMLHAVDTTKGQDGVRECELLQTEAPAFRMPDAHAMRTDAPVADTSTQSASDAAQASGRSLQTEGGPASLDPRVTVPMFNAAQNIAAIHQCDRLVRVRNVEGDNAHLFSTCPSGGAPLEIICNGANCHEGPPQG
ncbi:MAG TPA: DUF2846 domain-containing protein [Luteibacter sp.]|uniref:DUF2846 domain-containing protein n=1 Tax=Luteibacter sp. TaxID=1886636 RepID=UPI002B8A4285|nr:DUF2846 domain-containing protein [Luteibacter sp.]HVI53470.1 DUF2846 domain-containing protein [Luteibacter sp.]